MLLLVDKNRLFVGSSLAFDLFRSDGIARGALHTGLGASCSFFGGSLGLGVFESFFLDAIEVEAADVATAGVVRLNEISKLIREEFVDDLEVWDGAPLDSQSKPLKLSLGPLQGLSELRVGHANMIIAGG